MKAEFENLLDPEIRAGLSQLDPVMTNGKVSDPAHLAALKQMITVFEAAPFEHPGISLESRTIQANGREVPVLIYRHKDPTSHSGAGILWIHGGGNVTGTPREDDLLVPFVENLRCTVVSVDWKLAPEYQHPEGMEDCYAALLWASENAAELGIEPDKLAVAGESAGGGMAARTLLLNRERKGARVAFQLLKCPMLDNTHDTPSGRLEDHPLWDRQSSLWGWEAYLGGVPGKDASPLQSPARATDLADLPPTYIFVGTVELFRDEAIAYAQRLMQDRVPTELYVVPGLPHGGDRMVPAARISQAATDSIIAAFKRGLNIKA